MPRGGRTRAAVALVYAGVLGACSRDLTPRVDPAAARFLADSAQAIAPATFSGPSPDGRFVLSSDSVADATVRVTVTNAITGDVVPVVTIRESDPGSGRSDRLLWTPDSRALLITGTGSLHGERPQALCLVYRVTERDLIMPARCGT